MFALSIDDFVVTQYISSSGETTTIPICSNSNARGGATTPALNVVVMIMVLITLIGVGGAYLALRCFGSRPNPTPRPDDAGADGGRGADGNQGEEASAIETPELRSRGGSAALLGPTKTSALVAAVDWIDLEIAAASSSRCSGRPAAARRRRCG